MDQRTGEDQLVAVLGPNDTLLVAVRPQEDSGGDTARAPRPLPRSIEAALARPRRSVRVDALNRLAISKQDVHLRMFQVVVAHDRPNVAHSRAMDVGFLTFGVLSEVSRGSEAVTGIFGLEVEKILKTLGVKQYLPHSQKS